MGTQDVRKKKGELERKIHALVADFMNETEVVVADIQVDFIETRQVASDTTLYKLQGIMVVTGDVDEI